MVQAKYNGKKDKNFLQVLRALFRWGGWPPGPYLLEGGGQEPPLAGHQSLLEGDGGFGGTTASALMCKDILETAGCLPPPGSKRLDVQIGKKKLFMRNDRANVR